MESKRKPLKVAVLASAGSIHTIRWVNGLADAGINVLLLTQHKPIEDPNSTVKMVRLPFSGAKGYVLNRSFVRKMLDDEQVDLVHAHFAFGYATLARLSGKRPFIITVMGTDVDHLPNRYWLLRQWIRSNLKAADAVTVSSQHLHDQVLKLVGRPLPIHICHYGVSSELFNSSRTVTLKRDTFVFGTVKMLEHVYGIDRLILAFEMFLESVSDILRNTYRLRIVGSGSLSVEYKKMVSDHGLDDHVIFVPAVSHMDVASELAHLDVFMALSRREGFGVAIAEAGMMELPVIASRVGGIPEIIENGTSGFLVDGEDRKDIVEKMTIYSMNPELR
jgi:glycosyltransferase involved in cell wall biosynthesis